MNLDRNNSNSALSFLPNFSLFPIFSVNNESMVPKLLKLIEIALLLVQNVDDDIPIVQEHPASLRFAFDRPLAVAQLRKSLVDGFHDSSNLVWGFSSGYDEVVSQMGNLSYIQNHGAMGFF
jgi:hypothetical protein